MSKRNFILLIILMVAIVIAIFGFLFFRPNGNTGTENSNPVVNFISKFNPFKSSVPPTPPTPNPPINNPVYQPNPEDTPINTKLMKISTMPVAGFTVFMKERLKEIATPTTVATDIPPVTNSKTKIKAVVPQTETVPALRYVDRATGNIYQTFIDKIYEQKFSTTIIPKVYDAYFGNNGGAVAMRYLKSDDKTIETFVGTLPKEILGTETSNTTITDQTNEIKGSFLPDNVKDISISPDNQKIFYLFTNGLTEDSMSGVVLNLTNNKKVQIFDSPFTEWLSSWTNNNIINLTTKPSANVPGYVYSMDAVGKGLTKVLGDVTGLTTLESPNGKSILFADNNLSLKIYHTDTRTIDALSVKTLPEKCIWNKTSDAVYCSVPKTIEGGEYPDSWYQGEVSFVDQIWKIDVATNNATILIDPKSAEGGEEVDGIKLALDDAENYLFFVNKKDSFLWKLDLK